MPILTLEAIRQNPWNVLTHELPSDPAELLLKAAQLAATCCRQIDVEILDATRDNSTSAPSSEMCEAADHFLKANRKIGEIIGLLEEKFGVPAYDFWLSRNSG